MSQPEAPVFAWPVRVYYEDTDAAGMVYYANYLRFMERARSEWLRALGFNQSTMVATHGLAFVARSAQVDYFKPARLDDALIIASRMAEVKRAQVVFDQQILRGTELLARGRIRIACMDPATGRPAAMSADLLELFRAQLPVSSNVRVC